MALVVLVLLLSGFYRSRVFTSGNKRDIFFNITKIIKKKRQNACSKMTNVFLRTNTRDR